MEPQRTVWLGGFDFDDKERAGIDGRNQSKQTSKQIPDSPGKVGILVLKGCPIWQFELTSRTARVMPRGSSRRQVLELGTAPRSSRSPSNQGDAEIAMKLGCDLRPDGGVAKGEDNNETSWQ